MLQVNSSVCGTLLSVKYTAPFRYLVRYKAATYYLFKTPQTDDLC